MKEGGRCSAVRKMTKEQTFAAASAAARAASAAAIAALSSSVIANSSSCGLPVEPPNLEEFAVSSLMVLPFIFFAFEFEGNWLPVDAESCKLPLCSKAP